MSVGGLPLALQLGPETRSLVAFGLSLTSTVLGLAVGVLALQGYRRSRRRPMLFVAVGFFLTFWTPVLLLAGPALIPVVGGFVYGVLGEVSQVLGLLCILYRLWAPFEV